MVSVQVCQIPQVGQTFLQCPSSRVEPQPLMQAGPGVPAASPSVPSIRTVCRGLDRTGLAMTAVRREEESFMLRAPQI